MPLCGGDSTTAAGGHARGALSDTDLFGRRHGVRDLPGAEIVGIFRFEPDARATLLTATGSRTPLGSLWKLEPPLAIEAVLSTGRSARVDDYTHAFGETLDRVRHRGT